MRLAFLCPSCEPFYHGAVESRIWLFARQLARKHEVRVLTSCDAPHELDGVQFVPLAPARDFYDDHERRLPLADLAFAWHVLRASWQPFEADILDTTAAPYVHLGPARRLARRAGCPLVVTCHEALSPAASRHLASLPGTWSARQWQRWLPQLAKPALRRASHRLADSPAVASALEADSLPVQGVIEQGLDLAAFQPQAKAENGRLNAVFAGRLTPTKHVERALLAFHVLKQEGMPFDFHIIGTGSESPHLQAVAQGLGMRDFVHFHGFVSHQAKRHRLAAAHVFLVTAPAEPSAIGTLEAMAAGCAVVAAHPPAEAPSVAAALVEHGVNGLRYDGSPEGLAAALRDLGRDPDRIRTLAAAAAATAARFSIEEQTAKLEAFYRERLSAKS